MGRKKSRLQAKNPPVEAVISLNHFLPYRAARLATALSRSLAAHYEMQFSLSVAEWRVLVHLTQQSEISIRDIFERVDMDRARVTRAVQRLQIRNLVSKLVNEEDRRLVCLALTVEGWEMACELSRIAIDFEQRLLSAAAIDDGILSSFDALEAALAAEIDQSPPT
jgi:DNA-binding MarR family transcriptional regulator